MSDVSSAFSELGLSANKEISQSLTELSTAASGLSKTQMMELKRKLMKDFQAMVDKATLRVKHTLRPLELFSVGTLSSKDYFGDQLQVVKVQFPVVRNQTDYELENGEIEEGELGDECIDEDEVVLFVDLFIAFPTKDLREAAFDDAENEQYGFPSDLWDKLADIAIKKENLDSTIWAASGAGPEPKFNEDYFESIEKLNIENMASLMTTKTKRTRDTISNNSFVDAVLIAADFYKEWDEYTIFSPHIESMQKLPEIGKLKLNPAFEF
jgi:hypothetical protein